MASAVPERPGGGGTGFCVVCCEVTSVSERGSAERKPVGGRHRVLVTLGIGHPCWCWHWATGLQACPQSSEQKIQGLQCQTQAARVTVWDGSLCVFPGGLASAPTAARDLPPGEWTRRAGAQAAEVSKGPLVEFQNAKDKEPKTSGRDSRLPAKGVC